MIPYVIPADQPVPQWRAAEVRLEGAVARECPFNEIEVDVEFTSPDGSTVKRPAFWDGGTTWKARFAPDATGTWAWRSTCTDADDAGLNGASGTLECVPNSGETPVDRHGFIRVSANHRFFEHADGTPFFWLGDTHWLMPDTERTGECNHPGHQGGECPHGGQFQHLADVRREQGFTVYQLYPEFARRHWWTDDSHEHIDPARFRDVFDFEMDYLASKGFVLAVGLGHYTNSIRYGEQSLKRWARYVVARYGAHPVVWITCQEMNCPPELGGRKCNDQAVWERVAAEIARANGHRQPHSAHQWVLGPGERPVWHAPWHNWFALQGGHRGSGLTPLARYKAYRECEPVRPVLETEAMYEKVDCGGVADADDATRSAWRAMLAGCGGYTYGAAGIWALKWDPSDTAWKDYNHEVAGWYEGFALPGAARMKILRDFFETLPWTALEPRFDDAAWAAWEKPETRALATVGGSTRYLVFCHGGDSAGELRGMDDGAKYRARWMNAANGEIVEIGEIAVKDGVWRVPRMPGAGDWLLDVSKE